jgi:uncharacterized protein (UPF0335 family)
MKPEQLSNKLGKCAHLKLNGFLAKVMKSCLNLEKKT